MYAERSRFLDVDYNEVSDAAKGLIQEYFKVASKAPIHDTGRSSATQGKHVKRKVRSKARPETKTINNAFIKLDPRADADIAVVASGFTQATSKDYNFAPNKPLRNFSGQGTIAKPSANLRVMLEEHRQGEEAGADVLPLPQSKSIPLKSKSNNLFRPVDEPITDELGDSRPTTPSKPVPSKLQSGASGGSGKRSTAGKDSSLGGDLWPVSSSSRGRPGSAAAATTGPSGVGGVTAVVRPKTSEYAHAPSPRSRSPRSPKYGKPSCAIWVDSSLDSTDANLASNLPVLMTLVQGQLQKYMINREIVPAVDYDTTFQKDRQPQPHLSKPAGKPNWLSLARKLDDSVPGDAARAEDAQLGARPRPTTTDGTGSRGRHDSATRTAPDFRRRSPASSPTRRGAEGAPGPAGVCGSSPDRPRPGSPSTATVRINNQVRSVLTNISHECTLDIDNEPAPLNVTYTNVNANVLNDNGHTEPASRTLFSTSKGIQQQRAQSAGQTRKKQPEQVVYDNGVDIISSLTELIQKSRHSDWLVRSRTFQEAMRLIQQAREYNDSSAAYIAYQILRSHGEYATMYEHQVQQESYCTAKSYHATPKPANLTAADGTGGNELRQNEVVRYRRDPSALFSGKETRVIKEFDPVTDTGYTPGTSAKLLTAKLFNQAHAHLHPHPHPQQQRQQQQQQRGGQGEAAEAGHLASANLAEMTLESDRVNLSPRSASGNGNGNDNGGAAATALPGGGGGGKRSGRKGPARPVSAPAVRRGAPAPHRAVKHMAQCIL